MSGCPLWYRSDNRPAVFRNRSRHEFAHHAAEVGRHEEGFDLRNFLRCELLIDEAEEVQEVTHGAWIWSILPTVGNSGLWIEPLGMKLPEDYAIRSRSCGMVDPSTLRRRGLGKGKSGLSGRHLAMVARPVKTAKKGEIGRFPADGYPSGYRRHLSPSFSLFPARQLLKRPEAAAQPRGAISRLLTTSH